MFFRACLIVTLVATVAAAANPADLKSLPLRPYWTTSKVVGTPDPPPPFNLRRAFNGLKFDEPLELQILPQSDRWVIAERKGKIFTFANDPQTDRKDLLIDIGRTVYGVVMHPKFAENGYVYVANVLDPSYTYLPRGSRISRYKVTQHDPPKADPASEKVILEWPSGGHNGGCLRFGPDGYLYLSTGDGSGIADQWETGQDISDLLGSMLRIDVDHSDGDRPYRIPADNPFLNTKGARPEVYAHGLRQAWKFSFDPKTGDLWTGEIGQDLWESVYKIVKGGNYGWSIREGSHPFRPQRPLGPTTIQSPIIEHPHSEFRSITGGYMYHGRRFGDLQGSYIYGDYDTGRVWCLRVDGSKVTEHRELADTQLRIVAWGEDHQGELYALDFIDGTLHSLTPAPAVTANAAPFPRKLSETGLFTSTQSMQPAAGLIPYSVNAQLWSDGAVKERYLAIPGDAKIEFETVTYPQPAPGSEPGWRFPDGTVLVKTFSLETEPGNVASRRRLETRLLHVERVHGTEEVGDQVWRGYTYLWNDDQTDAELCDTKGLDREYEIKDAQSPGGVRKQTWHFPSRTECTVCHTVTAKYALGVNTAQLNRSHDYGGVVANQLAAFNHWNLFAEPLKKSPEQMTKLADDRDPSESIDRRARAYLQANCSHCHRKWGGGNAEFQLLHTLPVAATGTVLTTPGQGTFGLTEPKILVPGDPARSMIWHRMQRLGLGRMPHIASNVVDPHGVELIRAWIESLH